MVVRYLQMSLGNLSQSHSLVYLDEAMKLKSCFHAELLKENIFDES